ncbi:MAG: tetratricopeptide repeat protein [bacterium]|nr:tetratricopeptide repeat protein [bacterium]
MFNINFMGGDSYEAPAGEGRLFFQKAAEWCLIAIAFLLPIWFWPNTLSAVEFNKALMVSALVFIAFLCYLAQAITSGKIKMHFHWSFLLLLGALIIWLASALTSQFSGGLWGLGAEPTSFLSLLIFTLFFLLIGAVFDSIESLFKVFTAIFLGFALLTLGSLFSVFGWMKWMGGLFSDPTFNTIGSWNSLALAEGFFILMLYPLAAHLRGTMRIVSNIFLALALILMVAINFQLAWIITGFFALVILSYAIWRRNVSSATIAIPAIIIFLSIFGILKHDTIVAFTVAAPAEVGVNYQATIDVAKGALGKNMLLGPGPGTFGYLWDLYKPAAVNNTIFWQIRFSSGASYLLTMLAETGLLAGLMFLVFLIMAWYLGIKVTATQFEKMPAAISLASFLMLSYMLVVWSFYPVGYTLAALGFLSLGFVSSLAHILGSIRTYKFSLFGEGPKGLVSAMAVVVLIIASFGGIYLSVSKYIGQATFAEGLSAFNKDGNADKAESQLLLAARSEPRNDVYFRNLSQLYTLKAQLLLQNNSTPRDLLGSQFKDILDKAISASQQALNKNPMDYQNYRVFGKIYEFLVPLNATGALDAAIAQYDEAIKHAPTNPLLWDDKATAYVADATTRKDFSQLKKAEEALQKATDLKPDYTEAHFLLAQIFDAEGNIAEAIRRSEAAALLSPNNIGSLFQLGLLYYKANRLDDAKIIFERAVLINDNYSNARYFLGLIYDRQKRSADAITQFEKIAVLNPDNGEVKTILNNLKAGKSALSSIVPPQIAPEKRSQPPVSETSGSKGPSGR